MKKDKPTTFPSGIVTFVFTDIVGSTQIKERLPGESSSDRALYFSKLIKEPHDLIVTKSVTARGGVIVKGTGDGFLIAFADSEKAVLCGVEIQERLEAARIPIPDGQLQIRIGMNTGHAIPEGDDYGSSAVDKAKRVESAALPGTVYLSTETHGLVRNKIRTVSTQSAGSHKMSGFGEEELFVAVRSQQSGSTESDSARPSLGNLPPRNIALIGDPDKTRFEWFRDVLAQVYLIDSVQATTLDELKKLAHLSAKGVAFRIIFLTDSLPLSKKVQKADPKINFSKLEEKEQFFDSELACIVTKPRDPDLDGLERVSALIHLLSSPPVYGDREIVINELGKLRTIRPLTTSFVTPIPAQMPRVSGTVQWDQDSRTLRRQIRLLSELYDLEDGYEHLLRLISNFFDIDSYLKIEIKPLVQRKSGANVFHVTATDAVDSKEFVLKVLTRLDKVEKEVRGYHEAQVTTGVPGYRQHMATLRTPVAPLDSLHPERKFIVQSGRCFAIHYDFLGGERFGKFLDLETALITSARVLQDKTRGTLYNFVAGGSVEANQVRLKIFDETLDGLCRLWYANKIFSFRRPEIIWRIEDLDEREPGTLPPYQLRRRVKGLIQDFLESREAVIGSRLFTNWNNDSDNVNTLVSDTSRAVDLGRLGGSLPFTFSPVHCDLNASNVLLWLEHIQHPFVIDLPTFQSAGHCLQDFARLEVELKLVLLDRQEDSSVDQLPAFDYSDSQVKLWTEMEDALLAPQALDTRKLTRGRIKRIDWNAKGYHDNVDLCYQMVMLLRRKACQIQQQQFEKSSGPVSFGDEYLPALLYCTLQAISFSALPVIKRLLAVHGAGSILQKLK